MNGTGGRMKQYYRKRQGIKKVSLVGMMGKFSKVAQGVMMVHSKSAPVDFDFLSEIAQSVGADGLVKTNQEGDNK